MTGVDIGAILFVFGPIHSARNLWQRLNERTVDNPGGAVGEVAYLAVFTALPLYGLLKLVRRIP